MNRVTIDGGLSWQNIAMENYAERDQPKIISLQFVQGVYLGYVQLADGINMAKVKNGTMQVLNKITDLPYATFFCDTLIGYSAMQGGLRKTVNGGKTWSALRTGINTTFAKTFFTDQNHGTAIASNIILYTENGGLSWKDVSVPPLNLPLMM